MFYFILLLIALAGMTYLFIRMRFREERFLKKKSSETMRPFLREEIQREESEAVRKKKAFEKHLTKFKN